MRTFKFANRWAPKVAYLATVSVIYLAISIVIHLSVLQINEIAIRNGDSRNLIARAESISTSSEKRDLEIFFEADSSQESMANFQRLVQEISDKTSVALELIELEEVVPVGSLSRFEVRVKGILSESNLSSYLSEISLAEPMLLISDLKLRHLRNRHREDMSPRVQIALTICGFGEK